MTRVLVAVTASIAVEANGRPERATLNGSYLRAVEAAGAAPVMVAPQFGLETIESLMAGVAGLVLTGGGDVSPELYGEGPHTAASGISRERDAMELEALRVALDRQMPVLAICRGMQVLNVAMGGSLYQDLPTQCPSAVNHAQTSDGVTARGATTHDVSVEEGSRLAGVLGGTLLGTNSMHHQAVRQPGDGVVVAAWARDGVVEGLEMPGERWVMGVQWHPEELVATQEHARRLFAAFVAACGGGDR
jgi:putative glutamine amidotransferase